MRRSSSPAVPRLTVGDEAHGLARASSKVFGGIRQRRARGADWSVLLAEWQVVLAEWQVVLAEWQVVLAEWQVVLADW